MRRLLGFVVPASLAITLLAAPGLASAEADAADGTLVLAAEAEPQGPEPAPRDAEENPARELAGYEDRELQFTWGAAWILTFAGLVGLTVAGALYYLLVHRPSQRAREAEEAAGRR